MSIYDYNSSSRLVKTWNSRDELIIVISDYLEHFKANQEHILKTGYPKESFKKNKIIDTILSITYPIKAPANIYGEYLSYLEYKNFESIKKDIHEHAIDNVKYNFSWSAECPLKEFNLIDHAYKHMREKSVIKHVLPRIKEKPLVNYNEAEIMKFLNNEEAEKINTLRSSILKVKEKSLDIFLKHLTRTQINSSVLEDVFFSVAELFKLEDLFFLIQIEKKYLSSGFEEYLSFLFDKQSLVFSPVLASWGQMKNNEIVISTDNEAEISFERNSHVDGGIIILLYFAGYIEKEIEIEAISKVKRIKDAFGKKLYSKDPEKFNLIQEQYKKEEINYWKMFIIKLQSLVEEELKEEVNYNFTLKRKFLDQFIPLIEKMIDLQADYINRTGQPFTSETLNLKQQKDTAEHKYLFRKAGEGFEIAFNGKPSFFMKESVGLKYIYTLLSNKNKSITIQELSSLQQKNATKSVYIDKDDESYFSSGNKSSKEYDKQDLAYIMNKLNELIEEKDEANELGNFEKSENLQYKIEEVEKHIKDSQNTKTDPGIEKMRTSIRNAITDAIKKIRQHDSDLAQHLDEKIKTGYTCMYTSSPSENIEWKFSK